MAQADAPLNVRRTTKAAPADVEIRVFDEARDHRLPARARCVALRHRQDRLRKILWLDLSEAFSELAKDPRSTAGRPSTDVVATTARANDGHFPGVPRCATLHRSTLPWISGQLNKWTGRAHRCGTPTTRMTHKAELQPHQPLPGSRSFGPGSWMESDDGVRSSIRTCTTRQAPSRQTGRQIGCGFAGWLQGEQCAWGQSDRSRHGG